MTTPQRVTHADGTDCQRAATTKDCPRHHNYALDVPHVRPARGDALATPSDVAAMLSRLTERTRL